VNFLANSTNLEVVNLPNNNLPKGCVPLEKMFDRHDMHKGKPIVDQSDKFLEFNIDSKIETRMEKTRK
jgi:hypothetical protein